MQDTVREFLARRAVGELRAFTEETFRLGLELHEAGAGVCRCTTDPDGQALTEACRAFSAALPAASQLRSRCPQGFTVISQVVDIAPGRSLLLAAQGFLLEGDPEGPRPRGAVPRLTAAQAALLETYVLMGASLASSLSRSAGEVATECLREEAWQDLAGAPSLCGVSARIRALREALPTAANSREPLLIEGEPGAGRGLLAVTVHRLGPRRGGPFIRESLTALPDALHETELFGNGNGQPGLLAEAAGGTLYLAGVDRLTPAAQNRLLAALAPRRGAEPAADVRVIASVTGIRSRGRGLLPALGERLGALRLALPPLRERPEDVPLLVERLLARRAAVLGTPPVAVAPEALDALKRHGWAGNVRELDEELSRAAAGRSEIRLEDLPPAIARSARGGSSAPAAELRLAVAELERDMIETTLAETGWNKSRAAGLLGLSRLGLQKKIDRYRIDRRRQVARPGGGTAGT